MNAGRRTSWPRRPRVVNSGLPRVARHVAPTRQQRVRHSPGVGWDWAQSIKSLRRIRLWSSRSVRVGPLPRRRDTGKSLVRQTFVQPVKPTARGRYTSCSRQAQALPDRPRGIQEIKEILGCQQPEAFRPPAVSRVVREIAVGRPAGRPRKDDRTYGTGVFMSVVISAWVNARL